MKLFLLFLLTTSVLCAHRVVTLSPALSEIVAGLGNEQELVGVSSFATFPVSVTKLPKVGGSMRPSLEFVLSLKPSLVIGQEYRRAFLEKLQSMGIKVLIVKLDTIHHVQQTVTSIAKALHSDDSKLIKAIDNTLKESSKKQRTQSKVLIIYGAIFHPMQDTMFIAGKQTIYEDIITACGAHNAFNDSFLGEPRLRFENLIALNPDKVIMLTSPATDGTVDEKKIVQAWSQLPINASKNHNIHVLSDASLLIPSHRVASTVTKLCKVIAD